ncbi:uncharacterized protein ACHE_50004A [Aspergillus chevalieri]|uniref:Uncharacterized protein n=1 Tax=Aspergillus chevalieri TaxID=182096 RepID=A0A7R7ZPL4_ASPCH|nr:uncharacterized protein ACHE_50004A [Aspergillus chevalieri]BCR88806.1 hypothetical protein ACHE_50004A [Aspergillus chevalieri]
MRRGAIHGPLVAQYLARVARFKEKLAVAIHMTAGQPARAPELLSVQYVNTPNNQFRNVFIEDGMVTLVTAYHKGFHASNDSKLIHRYVPRAVGELVVWYMWLAMPFIDQLTAWQAGTAHGTVNGTSNGMSNGTSNGTLNGMSNGTSNGMSNGTSNGTLNGTQAGTVNGTVSRRSTRIMERPTHGFYLGSYRRE